MELEMSISEQEIEANCFLGGGILAFSGCHDQKLDEYVGVY